MKKKWWIISGVIVIIVAMTYVAEEEYEHKTGFNLGGITNHKADNSDLAHINWIKEYPQLAAVESDNQTAIIDKLRVSESISALIGPINNPYGVRDDILDEIVTMVPESNSKLLDAVIKSAYYDNLSSFSVTNKDKLNYEHKVSTAIYCIVLFDNNNLASTITKNYDRLMRNNINRKKYQENLEQTVFAWQLLGATDSGTKEQCLKGNY